MDNHGRVVYVPSTTAIDEDANIANSILYDGNGDSDSTRADGTQVRTVQSATKAVPRNTFIPATRRSTLNKSKTPKRRVSGVIRDMKKKVANAEVEHEDELNRNKANRFERMNDRLKARSQAKIKPHDAPRVTGAGGRPST